MTSRTVGLSALVLGLGVVVVFALARQSSQVAVPPVRPALRTIAGSAAIAGVVREGTQTVAADVEVYFRCRIEEVELSSASAMTMLDLLLREFADPPRPVAAMRTGDDGSFEVKGLPPGGYWIQARARDGAAGDRALVVPLDGARIDGSLFLSSLDENVRVRFTDPSGEPWSGRCCVRHEVDTPDGSLPPWFAGFSLPMHVPPDGEVTLRMPSSGIATVGAVDLGARRLTWRTVRSAGATISFRISPAHELLTGRLVHDGSPVRGARFATIGRHEDGTLLLWGTSDDGGAFPALPGLLLVRATGLQDLVRQSWDPEKEPEVHLQKIFEIRGRVVDAETRVPVVGAVVRAAPIETSTPHGALPAATAADGSFALAGLHPGEVMVFVMGGGVSSRGLRDVREGGYNPFLLRVPESTAGPLTLDAETSGRMQGSVQDADGRPVAGAVVRAEPKSLGFRHGPVEAAVRLLSVTDAGGVFDLESIPGTTYELAVEATGHALHDAGEVVPGVALRIRLPRSSWLPVVVVDRASRAPIAGATVWVRVQDTSRELAIRKEVGAWTTAADGRTLVGPLPPGRIWTKARASEHPAGDQEAVPEGASSHEIALTRGLVVAGRVVWSNGAAARGAAVQIEDQRTSTDESGRFHFAGLPRGVHGLSVLGAEKGRSGEARIDAEAGRLDIEIVLEPGDASKADDSVVVEVVAPDGSPVPAASGVYRDDVGEPYWVTVRQGLLRLERSTPGGSVEVWSATDADERHLPYGPARLELGANPPSRGLRLAMPPERVIAGAILGPDGRGVAGILLTALPPSRPTPLWPPLEGVRQEATARTDVEGRFELRGLGDETYRIGVSAPPVFLPLPERQVTGGTTDLTVHLVEGRSARVEVIGPDDRPVAGAEVRVLVERREVDSRGGFPMPTTYREPMRSGSTGADGVVVLVGLDPGRKQSLDVRPPTGREDLLGQEIPAWIPRDERIRLETGRLVRGRVVDGTGNGVSGAQVLLKTGPSAWTVSEVQDGGFFVLRGLRPGELVLRARMEATLATEVERRVPDGTTDVVLVIEEPGLPLVVQVRDWPSERSGTQATLRSEDAIVGSTTRRISADGTARFHGLRPTWKYTLWIPPGPGGLSYLRKGIPGDSRSLVVTLQKGESIVGRVHHPDGATNLVVWASEMPIGIDIRAPGLVRADGTFVVEGLPAGDWYVHARATLGSRTWEKHVRARAGGTAVSIDLR